MSLRERLGGLALMGQDHIIAVMDLVTEFGHSIRPIPSIVPLERYTCLVYALEFQGEPEYEAIAGLPIVNVFAGADFANWLLTNGYLIEVTAQEATPGCYALYSDEAGGFVHIGILRNDGRVASKWGNQGLYDHALLEVPFSYGSNVRYYLPIPFYDCIELFKDFAEERGVQFTK